MPYCNPTNHTHRLLLGYSAVGLGVLGSLFWFVFFIRAWRNRMTDEHRNSVMTRLMAVVIFSCLFERVLRSIEIYFRFYSVRLVTDIIKFTNSFIASSGVIIATSMIYVLRLQSTFQDSAYRISERELKFLKILILMVSVLLYTMLSVLHSINDPIIVTVCSVLFAVVAGIFIIRVDWAFTSRLQTLVASHIHHCGTLKHKKLSNDNNNTDNAYVSEMNQSPSMSDLTTKNRANNLQNTFHEIRNSSLADFMDSQKSLLSTASVSTNLALWTTFACLLFTASMILFTLGDCYDMIESGGHVLIALTYSVVSICVLFGLKIFEDEYRIVCGHCDNLIVKCVVWSTVQRVNDNNNQE